MVGENKIEKFGEMKKGVVGECVSFAYAKGKDLVVVFDGENVYTNMEIEQLDLKQLYAIRQKLHGNDFFETEDYIVVIFGVEQQIERNGIQYWIGRDYILQFEPQTKTAKFVYASGIGIILPKKIRSIKIYESDVLMEWDTEQIGKELYLYGDEMLKMKIISK